MEKKALKDLLHSSVVQVAFTKLNGDIRIMDCTLDMDKIPPSAWPKDDGKIREQKEEINNIHVFDVKAQGWRSFLFDRVFKIN